MKKHSWIFGAAATILLSLPSVVTSFTLPSSSAALRRHVSATSTSTTSASPIRLSAESNGDGDQDSKKIVVIGNGMVGQRFMENLLDLTKDAAAGQKCTLATFCEEPRAAYNRVKLTSYFETRDPSALTMTGPYEADGRTQWYADHGVELYLNDKAVAIDTEAKTITGQSGREIPYDVAVLATGSYPFVPPIPGRHRPGVFVYRTIEDLEAMLAYVRENNVQSAAVIGGGLLGLEAAKAVADMDVTSHSKLLYLCLWRSREVWKGNNSCTVAYYIYRMLPFMRLTS